MNDSKQREVTVPSALQAHQLRQWLNAHKIDWRSWPLTMSSDRFLIVASPEQWVAINQWLEKTKVGP